MPYSQINLHDSFERENASYVKILSPIPYFVNQYPNILLLRADVNLRIIKSAAFCSVCKTLGG